MLSHLNCFYVFLLSFSCSLLRSIFVTISPTCAAFCLILSSSLKYLCNHSNTYGAFEYIFASCPCFCLHFRLFSIILSLACFTCSAYYFYPFIWLHINVSQFSVTFIFFHRFGSCFFNDFDIIISSRIYFIYYNDFVPTFQRFIRFLWWKTT